MSPLSRDAARWKWCAITCLTMVLLSLVPQIHLWLVRGRDWNGAYVGPYGDELIYAAYVNALINGRTRKNDPFWGADNSASAPLPESIFSIQFVPAYAIALPARAFGVSASTAFIVLIVASASLASLSIFLLLDCLIKDHRVAVAGTLFILCLGCVGGRYGFFGTFLDIGFPALPFLRRYQPAASFSLFFVFQYLVWMTITSRSKRNSGILAILSGITLAVLIFSYLYLWTAAAAWLICFGFLWWYLRPPERLKTMTALAPIVLITVIALVPYAYMVFHRAITLDQQQILTSTHTPDVLRFQEIIGALILVSLFIGIRRSKFSRTEPRVIYSASLASLPFVVFNQQVATGRTMQAFHFETFIVNYSTLLGLIVCLALSWRPIPRRLLTWISALSLSWGIIIVGVPSRLIFVPWAISNDKKVPVLRRLNELSKWDGTLGALHTKGQASTVVFSPSVPLIALMPTWTSQGALLDATGADCRGQTREERKEFFYMHLYYSKTDSEALRRALNNQPDGSSDELSNVRTVVFGHERVFPGLTSQFKSIQPDEVEREVQTYKAYADSFTREEARKRQLTYAVIPVEGNFDFSNLDRWYERDAGELFGAYTLYRLKLRS